MGFFFIRQIADKKILKVSVIVLEFFNQQSF